MSVAVQCMGFDCPSFMTRPSSEGIDQSSSRKLIATIREEIAKFRGSESMTFGRPLNEALTSLFEIYEECSIEDWDGYGAVPVTPETFAEAKRIIDLLPSSIQMPEMVGEPTGEIGFEWRGRPGRIFVMAVSGRHRITYAGIFDGNKTNGSEHFEETLPSVVIEHLRRLYSKG
jgi:hypothetical protein